MQEAQKRMREALDGVEMAILVASMLHAIATGNLLPATVRTVVVDINPSVVTKFAIEVVSRRRDWLLMLSYSSGN